MRTVPALTAAGLLTLALAACGNGQDGASQNATVAQPSASSTTQQAAPSQTPSERSSSASSSTFSSTPSSTAASASSTSPSTSDGASASDPAAPQASATGSGAAPSGSQDSAGPTASASSAPSTSGTATAYAYAATGWSQFTTPTGRNWCDMTKGVVGCHLTPEVSAKHGGANYVMLTPKGVGFLTGDPGFDTDGEAARWTSSVPNAPVTTKDGTAVLGYGSSFTSAETTCTSNVSGMTCTNAVASFTVSTGGVTMTGKLDPTRQN